MGPNKKRTISLRRDLVIMENHHDNEAGVEAHNQETEVGIVTTSQEMIVEGIEEIGTVAIKIETDTGTAITETEAERRIDTVGMTMTVGLEDKERNVVNCETEYSSATPTEVVLLSVKPLTASVPTSYSLNAPTNIKCTALCGITRAWNTLTTRV
jgi:hypothetical protein